jgi:hypothetical protein
MAKVIFLDSEADKMELETPEEFALVKKAVFEKGDKFWDGGDGACGIYYKVEGVKGAAHMIIIAREEFGFIISHSPAGSSASLMLSTGVKDDRIVYPEVGGDPYEHYREYCVSKEMAWQAIDHFMKTGEKDPSLIWTQERVPD